MGKTIHPATGLCRGGGGSPPNHQPDKGRIMTLTEEFKEYMNLINKWWEHKEKTEANPEASTTEEEEAWQEMQSKEWQLVERLRARSYRPHHITHDERVFEIDYTQMKINYIYAPKTETLDLA